MTNAEKFQRIFGYYATEIWAKSESEFLEWINSEYPYTEMDLELEEIWEDMREADDEDGAKMERNREMIECIKVEDVLTCIIFQVVGKDLTCGELKEIVDKLPKVVIGKESTVVNLIDEIYPVGSYYFDHYGCAINPNDLFGNTEWECYGPFWKRVK